MGNAIYESNWTVQDKATKRTLLIMMIRTQIPLTIDVGPFIRMDAAATLTVLLALKVVYLFMIVVFFVGFQGNVQLRHFYAPNQEQKQRL